MNVLAYKKSKQYTDSMAAKFNGSPKGVYATLTALQTAFPTGDNGIYVVTADGQWYYWSGSAWIAGGVYQASSVAGDISDMKEVGYVAVTAINTISDYSIYCNTGYTSAAFTARTNRTCTVYPVTAGKKYFVRGFGYDANDFITALVCADNINPGGGSSVLQTINVASSINTTHTVEFTATNNGYLYVNARTDAATAVVGIESDILKINVPKFGIIVASGTYRHFARAENGKYIVREFSAIGPNSLVQLSHIGLGVKVGSDIIETESIMNAYTDQVGPISIGRNYSEGGRWSGGYHSVTVNSVDYPTAQQESLSVLCNGVDVKSTNGMYIGASKIIATNKLYFPATITGSDLSTATQAIRETCTYLLDDTMRVFERLDFVASTYVSAYYGMQMQDDHVATILLPSNESELTLANLTQDYYFANKETELILKMSNGYKFVLTIDNIGLGTFVHNNGATAYKYGYQTVGGKIYFVLFANSGTINSGTVLIWQGEYGITLD